MCERRRSVLFVHSRDLTTPFGSTVPYYLTRELAESHAVHVICRRRSSRRDSDGDRARNSPAGIALHDIDTGEIPVLSGVLFVVLSTLYAVVLAARYRFDVVYAFQSEMVQGWAGARSGRSRFVVGLQSVPVRQARDLDRSGEASRTARTVVAGALRGLYASIVRRLLADATEVICLTDGIRSVTEESYGIDLSDASVIGMGIDTATFAGGADADPDAGTGDPREASPNDGRGPDAWTLTYVGTVHTTRGLDHVIEAIAASDRDLELRIAGDGSDEQVAALKRLARELGVDDRIEWLGLVPHEDVPALLRETDVAVSPLTDIESYRISFPAKLLEYMAAGAIVVATDIPPHRTLVEDGENGFLYDGAASSFLDAFSRCLACEASHPSIRRAARRTAAAYDWDAIVGEHERVIFS